MYSKADILFIAVFYKTRLDLPKKARKKLQYHRIRSHKKTRFHQIQDSFKVSKHHSAQKGVAFLKIQDGPYVDHEVTILTYVNG